MIEKGLFPEDIRAYLNSHPVFNQNGGTADNNVFYHTQLGNLVRAVIHHYTENQDYICSQYNISKDDCNNVADTFRATWVFDPEDKANLTMENATTFLKIMEIFYQEYYKKPSEFQFSQETVTIQDEEDFIV